MGQRSRIECPYCKRMIELQVIGGNGAPGAAGAFSYRTSAPVRTFPLVAGGHGGDEQATSFVDVDRIAMLLPQWNPSTQGAVTVPALQSLVSGAFVGLGAFGFAALVPAIPAPGAVGLLAGFATSGLVWFLGLKQSRQRVWEREIARPVPEAEPGEMAIENGPGRRDITVHIMEGQTMRNLGFPVDDDPMILFAREAINGRALTERNFGGGGKLFSGSEFAELRDYMILNKLGRWNNKNSHQQGWALTHKGVVTLTELANLQTSDEEGDG